MLEKEPAKRFPTLGEAATALEAAASIAKGATARPRLTAAAVAPAAATFSPTTPIPRTSQAVPTTAQNRRTGTAARPMPAAPLPQRRSLVPALALLLLVAAGGWFATTDRFAALMASSSVPAAAALATGPGPAAPPLPDSSPPLAAADSAPLSADTLAPTDSGTKAASLESEIAMFAARVASAPVVDLAPMDDSAVVRLGSQTLETVLFVNGAQLGVVGGRGLISTTVAPGAVQLSIRKVGCRDWDTTFTTLAGRRYTFAERSPRC
jgi:hypothetical protein